MTLVAKDQNPPRLDSVSKPQELPFQKPNTDCSLPTAIPQPDSAAPPVLGPPFLSKQESLPVQLAPEQLTDPDPQPQLRNAASILPVSRSLAGPPAALDPSDAQGQHQTQTRCLGSASHSPPGFSAVWKKNQGNTPLSGFIY